MPAKQLTKKFALLTVNATSAGLCTIASNTNWLPGALVWIRSNTVAGLQCMIVEQVGATQIRLRDNGNGGKFAAFTDLSAYLQADAASVALEPQVVRVDAPFTAIDKR